MMQNHFIKAIAAPHTFSSHHYSTLSYRDFARKTHYLECELLQNDGLCFMNYVGYQQFSSKDLIFYPELTKALRQLNDYPSFTKKYPINEDLKGMAFIQYLLNYILECEKDFQSELAKQHAAVNHLIQIYGNHPVRPLILGATKTDALSLNINGLNWRMVQYSHYEKSHIYFLEIDETFDLKRAFQKCQIEAFIPNTSYLAIRLGASYKHQGKLVWYSLENFKPVNLNDIKRHKSLIQTI
jgi:hypothetical protein